MIASSCDYFHRKDIALCAFNNISANRMNCSVGLRKVGKMKMN